jgi:hypothetical protein
LIKTLIVKADTKLIQNLDVKTKSLQIVQAEHKQLFGSLVSFFGSLVYFFGSLVAFW